MDFKEQVIEFISNGEIGNALDTSLVYYESIKEKKSIYKILLKLKSDHSSARTDRNKNLIDDATFHRRISVISDQLINLSDDEYVDKLLKIIFLKRMGMILVAALLLLLALFSAGLLFPEKGIKYKKISLEKQELVFDFYKLDPDEKTYLVSVFVLDPSIISLGTPTLKSNGKELPYPAAYEGLQDPLDVFHKPKVKMTFPEKGNYQLSFEVLEKNEDLQPSEIIDQIKFQFEGSEGEAFDWWQHGLYLPGVRQYLFWGMAVNLIAMVILFFVIHLRTLQL